MILAIICNDFSDVALLRMYPQRPQSDDPIITYKGAKTPVGQVEEFAKALDYFITNYLTGGYTRMI